MTDRELWACANQLVEQHGRGAVIKEVSVSWTLKLLAMSRDISHG